MNDNTSAGMTEALMEGIKHVTALLKAAQRLQAQSAPLSLLMARVGAGVPAMRMCSCTTQQWSDPGCDAMILHDLCGVRQGARLLTGILHRAEEIFRRTAFAYQYNPKSRHIRR